MKKNMKFDTAIKELERIVNQLENQDMPLEKALASFEEGIKLARHCNRLLEEAEKRVEVLTRDPETGQILKTPWEDEKD
ncbi:MAG: exodeoxyribonuclease VII small subunit [Thermodesulfatator sp.]|nr:MAG: exodeoxyribonuclease VII small subunit [Thermodesulfatator sp.]